MDAPAIEIDSRDTGALLSVTAAFMIREATPEEVFDYVSDPKTVPIWQSDAVSQTQISPGPVREGTLFDNRKRFLRHRFSTVTEVITYSRPKSFTFRSDGNPRYTFVYRFTPAGEGTAVHMVAEFPRLPGLFGLIPRRILRRAIVEELRANHLTLKRILEASA